MRRLAVGVAALLLGGCAASPVTTKPSPTQAKPVQAQAEARSAFYANPARGWSNPEPGLAVTFFDPRDPDRAQLMVRPAEIDLDKLPRGTIPEPLDVEKAPRQLPTSIAPSELRVDRSYSWSGDSGTATVSVEGRLVSLQIGNVSEHLAASDRVYHACSPNLQGTPLKPARWMSLSRDARGRVRLRVVDAWFDSATCQASVARVTVIEPARLLGGLAYAFRSTCSTCQPRDSLVLLMPPVSTLAHGSVGKSAKLSSGTFMLARVSLTRGAAASLGGPVQAHILDPWYATLGGTPAGGEAIIGIDVSHAVSESEPVAIAYATLVRR